MRLDGEDFSLVLFICLCDMLCIGGDRGFSFSSGSEELFARDKRYHDRQKATSSLYSHIPSSDNTQLISAKRAMHETPLSQFPL